MTGQDFRDLLRDRPFIPLRVVMSRERACEVRQPEMAFVTRSDRHIGLDIQEDELPSRFKVCSLLQVTAVEPLESTTNGKST